ncbi:MAG: Asp-tRNA(Asn)/Glu-tRNA(Gln) amidotransferase subunit GatB [Clostridia bacterium]|nr:Asp-tRNA(Asn)/Glu-tRNA(Gln) amidotransferase subunit GatB [Clostridia bacterium]
MSRVAASTEFETVIGLEVHVELSTESKMFCACRVTFGDPPNTHVCPVCLGLPGALPVPNRRAVEYAVRAALALHCEIAPVTKFDRKNYHYPDLPKGYQISQFDRPLGTNGYLDVPLPGGGTRRVRIRRLHLEEDAGKSLHDPRLGTLVDLNRAGVPLIEIVSEPDLRSPEEARAYLQELRNVMLYTGVSDVRMEEGSLRCDANISIRPVGSDAFGTLVEVKNMNSFRAVKQALEYEAERQRAVVLSGERVVRETRHWNERAGQTTPSRSKEEAHDYRYFPEPDLVPLRLDADWVEQIRRSLPELPAERRARYERLGLSAYDASVLVDQRPLADFFDACLDRGADAKQAANWVMVELQGYLNETGETLADTRMTPEGLVALLRLIEEGTITGKIAKEIFPELVRTGGDPRSIVEARGLVQIADREALYAVVKEVLAQNPAAVEDYRKGKTNAVGFLVGQVMKATRGRANPALANELVRQALEE